MNTVVINTDGSWKIIDQPKITLEDFQKVVGGWIEGISINEHLTMYCNEEGKILGLPVNHLATYFVKNLRPFNDFICGDVVFSKINEEGEEISLSLDDMNYIIDYIEIYQNA